MALRTIQEELLVELTKTEWTHRANEMANKLKELGEYQAKIAEEKKVMAKTEKDLEKEINRLGCVVRDNKEPRQVECREEISTSDTVDLIRLDTGAVVSNRPMTEQEIKEHRQGKLFAPGYDERAH